LKEKKRVMFYTSRALAGQIRTKKNGREQDGEPRRPGLGQIEGHGFGVRIEKLDIGGGGLDESEVKMERHGAQG